MRKPYRHLLIPTDGSPRAAAGVRSGMALARALGARVTGLYVAPKEDGLQYGAAAVYGAHIVLGHLDRQSSAQAKKVLAGVQAAAKKARVRCGLQVIHDDRPWHGMLQVARKRGCDLIVLASRGHVGLAGLLLGSETARLLSRSKIAVLVVR